MPSRRKFSSIQVVLIMRFPRVMVNLQGIVISCIKRKLA